LVAELSAAFGCASLGIVPTVRAASQASKAADYLLGFVPEFIVPATPDLVVGGHEAP